MAACDTAKSKQTIIDVVGGCYGLRAANAARASKLGRDKIGIGIYYANIKGT